MAYFPMFVELEGRPCLIVGRRRGRAAQGAQAAALWPVPDGGCAELCAGAGSTGGSCAVPPGISPPGRGGTGAGGRRDGRRRAEPGDRRAVPGAAHPCERGGRQGQLYLPVPGAGAAAGRFPSGISTGGASPTAAVYVKEKIEAALPAATAGTGYWNIWPPGAPLFGPRCRTKPPGARLFAALFDACMEKGRPLEQAEFDALAARMEREGPGDA